MVFYSEGGVFFGPHYLACQLNTCSFIYQGTSTWIQRRGLFDSNCNLLL